MTDNRALNKGLDQRVITQILHSIVYHILNSGERAKVLHSATDEHKLLKPWKKLLGIKYDMEITEAYGNYVALTSLPAGYARVPGDGIVVLKPGFCHSEIMQETMRVMPGPLHFTRLLYVRPMPHVDFSIINSRAQRLYDLLDESDAELLKQVYLNLIYITHLNMPLSLDLMNADRITAILGVAMWCLADLTGRITQMREKITTEEQHTIVPEE